MSTILVVDDMSIFREPIAAALRHRGYQTLTAGNGREALAVMGRCVPDLVLLDVAMPEMDGLSMLRALRATPAYSAIPVILLTAVAERDPVIQAAKLGVQDYLLKSRFSLEEMIGRIQKRLGGDQAASGAAVASSSWSIGAVPSKPSGAPGSVAAGKGRLPPAHSPRMEQVENTPQAGRTSGRTPPLHATHAAGSRLDALSELQPIIAKKELIALVAQGLELRPLAPVVQNVMAATASPECSVDDVAKAVAQDQALSVRILKVANGCVYSRGRPVDTIKSAVARLGSREVRHLVMTLGVLQEYEGGRSEHVDVRLFWEHSMACGLLAAGLGRECGFKESDDFFLWGLLHDVGRLILLELVPDRYAQVCEVAQKLRLPLELVEARLMMMDHCAVLERALEHWRFPKDFIIPVVNHHQSPALLSRLGNEYVRPAALLSLANRLAQALLLGSGGNPVLYPLDEMLAVAGVQAEVLTRLGECVPGDVNDLKVTLLARMNRDSWPDLAAQLAGRLTVDVAPLCISPEPATDVFRMFLQRLGKSCQTAGPNVAILSAPEAHHLQALYRQLQAHEVQSKSGPLPLLLILERGEIASDDVLLAGRPHAILKTPLLTADLISSLEQLLGAKQAAEAAALA